MFYEVGMRHEAKTVISCQDFAFKLLYFHILTSIVILSIMLTIT